MGDVVGYLHDARVRIFHLPLIRAEVPDVDFVYLAAVLLAARRVIRVGADLTIVLVLRAEHLLAGLDDFLHLDRIDKRLVAPLAVNLVRDDEATAAVQAHSSGHTVFDPKSVVLAKCAAIPALARDSLAEEHLVWHLMAVRRTWPRRRQHDGAHRVSLASEAAPLLTS